MSFCGHDRRRRRTSCASASARALSPARLDAADDLHHLVDRGRQLVDVDRERALVLAVGRGRLGVPRQRALVHQEADLDRRELAVRLAAARRRCTCRARCGRTPRRSRRRSVCFGSSSSMMLFSAQEVEKKSAPVCALSSSIIAASAPPKTSRVGLALDLVLVRRAEVVRRLVEDRREQPGLLRVRRSTSSRPCRAATRRCARRDCVLSGSV